VVVPVPVAVGGEGLWSVCVVAGWFRQGSEAGIVWWRCCLTHHCFSVSCALHIYVSCEAR
jgi:hypothetical protein